MQKYYKVSKKFFGQHYMYISLLQTVLDTFQHKIKLDLHTTFAINSITFFSSQ